MAVQEEDTQAEGGTPGTPGVADEPSGGVVGSLSKHQ